MLRLSYPSRWRYDILRALEYFQKSGWPHDARMDETPELLSHKRSKDGTWPLQARHKGTVHFDMELPGHPSRWNTLRTLRVLHHFNIKI